MTFNLRNVILFYVVICWHAAAQAFDLDDQLQLVIKTYGLEPALCTVDPRILGAGDPGIGRLLFKSQLLSGDKDTACSSCHQESATLTDGLPLAVGVGGEGEGKERLSSQGVVVPRNAFTLFGRAAPNFSTYFWDGKVMYSNGRIYSPLGEGRSLGFASALAVASVLPILARDEFLGRQDMFSSNSHLEEINSVYYEDKVRAANEVLQEILTARQDPSALQLLKLLKAQGLSPDDFTLSFVGNALAAFIAERVSNCPQTAWEKYLNGKPEALTDIEKKGALIFFGKGRCAGCHSGSQFTDFQFHSIGVPQGDLGPHIHGQDLGRADVTYQLTDRFRFRTPPLLLVSHTAPYGHNGTFSSLEEVVRFHLNPILFFVENDWTSEREALTYGKILASRSSRLAFIDVTSDPELFALVEFLKTL